MARLARVLLPVLPLVLGFVSLFLLDLSERTEPPPVHQLEPAPDARLFVLMIDSLDHRDVVTKGSLPGLHARLPGAGLHGHVRACVDGVTIPCVSAMVTGLDRASGFSPLRNFGAANAISKRSLLGELERRGQRVGYFGEAMLADALPGLSVLSVPEHEGPVDDDATLRAALSARDELDLIFIHLLSLDEAAHKFGATGPAYARALARMDARIERVFAVLRPRDHLVVLGDHGHEPSGRHSADVGTDTYAAYFGPRFARHAEGELVMTDHASLWARVFGLRWGRRELPERYFAGRPLQDAEHATLATRPRAAGPLLAAIALALCIALASPWRARLRFMLCMAALSTLLMLAASATVRGAYHALAGVWGSLISAAVAGLAGGALVAMAWRERRPREALPLAALGVTGALLFALPTAEPTAGIKAPVLWLLGVLLVRLARGAPQRARLVGCALVLFVLALIRVRDYLPRSLLELDVGALGVLVPALLMLAAAHVVGGARATLATALGELAVALLPDPSARWLIAPAAVVLPLAFTGFRSRLGFELTCLLMPVACSSFFPDDTGQLGSVTASWLLWAFLPRALRAEALWLRASSFVLLMWLSFWTAMSTRVGGVDYDFYFRWLPANESATGEAGWQGLLTAAKCMLPVVFGALLATRAGGVERAVLACAEHLTRIRLALTVVFVAGLSLTPTALNVQWIYDATQEVAFWILMFAVLGLVAAASPRACDQPPSPRSA